MLPLRGEPAPAGRPFELLRFDNRHGQSVQGFLVTPAGSGPWPILIRPHGGPTWLDEDKWHPEVQSYVDAGLAVVPEDDRHAAAQRVAHEMTGFAQSFFMAPGFHSR